MDLFCPVVPEDRWHQHFRTVLAPEFAPCRSLVEQWATGFPDRDGKFVQEFQISFNSPFWELYLYAVFREYGFALDWKHAAPDFFISRNGQSICVEAVTANAADGKPNEWDVKFKKENFEKIDIKKLNLEAIIRLANSIRSKYKKYQQSYSKHPHVVKRPFVLAVAPFEQPFFNHQYSRPIKALLYDHYVDEEAYLANPSAYPNGPPARQLGFVEKDNGAEIELGLFNDDRMPEISAVIFSCTATWGKVDALAPESDVRKTIIQSVWGSEPLGRPVIRAGWPSEIGETLTDGLQIYHNPYALYPLDPAIFRKPGVVQEYFDETKSYWVAEELNRSLFYRLAFNLFPTDDNSEQTLA